jgi:hypothetical protein
MKACLPSCPISIKFNVADILQRPFYIGVTVEAA